MVNRKKTPILTYFTLFTLLLGAILFVPAHPNSNNTWPSIFQDELLDLEPDDIAQWIKENIPFQQNENETNLTTTDLFASWLSEKFENEQINFQQRENLGTGIFTGINKGLFSTKDIGILFFSENFNTDLLYRFYMQRFSNDINRETFRHYIIESIIYAADMQNVKNKISPFINKAKNHISDERLKLIVTELHNKKIDLLATLLIDQNITLAAKAVNIGFYADNKEEKLIGSLFSKMYKIKNNGAVNILNRFIMTIIENESTDYQGVAKLLSYIEPDNFIVKTLKSIGKISRERLYKIADKIEIEKVSELIKIWNNDAEVADFFFRLIDDKKALKVGNILFEAGDDFTQPFLRNVERLFGEEKADKILKAYDDAITEIHCS